jgi:hypothetical protein
MVTSACPGEVDTGSPTRTCANQVNREHSPIPQETGCARNQQGDNGMLTKLTLTGAAILAALAAPALARQHGGHARRHAAPAAPGTTTNLYSGGLAGARASFGRSYDFEAWPTDYLITRFGDRQAQGR